MNVRDQDEQFARRHEERGKPSRWDQTCAVPEQAPSSRELHLVEANGGIAKMPRVRQFDSGATREDASEKLDFEGFLSPEVLHRFGEYMHKHRHQADGSLRDSDNWQKGIPFAIYMKSLMRHVLSVWRAHRKLSAMRASEQQNPVEMNALYVQMEEDLCGVFFNTQGYLHELLKSRS